VEVAAGDRQSLAHGDFEFALDLSRVRFGQMWGNARAPGVRGKSEHHQATRRVEYAGSLAERLGSRKVSQKIDRPAAETFGNVSPNERVRVKRRGKSPPPVRQLAGHEKPRVVQDKTGNARRLARLAEATSDLRKFARRTEA